MQNVLLARGECRWSNMFMGLKAYWCEKWRWPGFDPETDFNILLNYFGIRKDDANLVV